MASCHRCRVRKVRCDASLPCKMCVRDGVECVRTSNDRRKERFSAEYVESLRERITDLENVINGVRNLVDGGPVQNEVPRINISETPAKATDPRYPHPTGFDGFEGRSLAVYGPTSVFDSELVQYANEIHEISELRQDPYVIHCIKLFFKWQYPDHNIFVYREAFLIDFFNPKRNSSYCLLELIFAICSMGSKMSDDDRINHKLRFYYTEAKTRLLRKLDSPTIPSMQAFLLLAFHDICDGNNLLGWMLSGDGIRMGYDLGFQLNPKAWFLDSNESISNLNISIRSRIFWGCYVADHFISLLLGRPSFLKMSDTTIPEPKDLPEIEWIEEYSYIRPGSDYSKDLIVRISSPLKSLTQLINISDDMLSDVFTRNQSDKFDLSLKVSRLRHYNLIILEWRSSLPLEVQWTQNLLDEEADTPTNMSIKYYYYILLLCLNRPFVDITKHDANQRTSPSRICADVMDDLVVAINRFRVVHKGLRRASVFIVYCAILLVSVLLLSTNTQALDRHNKERIAFFMTVLAGCFRTWKLAEKSYKLVEQKLEHIYGAKVTLKNGIVVINLPKIHPEPEVLKVSEPPQPATPREAPVEEMGVGESLDFFGGPPLLMTSDLFNQEWGDLFPDYALALRE